MHVDERKRAVQVNWTAILSYSGSLAVSLAIWFGVIRAVQYLVK
jgi:hypothetical protein